MSQVLYTLTTSLKDRAQAITIHRFTTTEEADAAGRKARKLDQSFWFGREVKCSCGEYAELSRGDFRSVRALPSTTPTEPCSALSTAQERPTKLPSTPKT